MRTRLIGASILFLLFIFIIPFSQDTEALQAQTVINLDQSEITAEPADRFDEINVTISGTVSCDTSGLGGTVQRVFVTLIIWVDTDWRYEVTPSSMVFEDQITEVTFTLSVTVPRDTNRDIIANVTVNGEATITPGGQQTPVVPDYADIKVQQYIGLEASFTENIVNIKSGESVSNFIDIINSGNGKDTVRIALGDGKAQLLDAGFELFVPIPEIRLFQRESGTGEIRIEAPEKIKSTSSFDLTIVVTSTASESKGSLIYNEIRFEIRAEAESISDTLIDNTCKITIGISITGLIIVIAAFVLVFARLKKK